MLFLVLIRATLVEVVHILLRGAIAILDVRMLWKHLLPCPHAGGLILQLAIDRYMYMTCLAAFLHVEAHKVADESLIQRIHDRLRNIL